MSVVKKFYASYIRKLTFLLSISFKVPEKRSRKRFLYKESRPPCRVCNRPGKDYASHYHQCYFCEKCEKFKTNKSQHEPACKGKVTPKLRLQQCPDCREEFSAKHMTRHRFRKHGYVVRYIFNVFYLRF